MGVLPAARHANFTRAGLPIVLARRGYCGAVLVEGFDERWIVKGQSLSPSVPLLRPGWEIGGVDGECLDQLNQMRKRKVSTI